MMNMSLTTAATNEAVTDAVTGMGGAFSPERIKLSVEMLVVGMAMIFTVLAVLWLVLKIFAAAFGAKDVKKASAKTEPERVADTAAAAPLPQTDLTVANDSDEELVAVITAAIAAYRAENTANESVGGFRVVSFRRVGGGRAWNSNK